MHLNVAFFVSIYWRAKRAYLVVQCVIYNINFFCHTVISNLAISAHFQPVGQLEPTMQCSKNRPNLEGVATRGSRSRAGENAGSGSGAGDPR